MAITGPCAFVDTWGAVIIGGIGGFVYYCSSRLILFGLKIDDPLDAAAVHAGCGAWGMIGGALLSSSELVEAWYGPLVDPGGNGDTTGTRPYGLFLGGGGRLLGAHVVYILVIAAWTSSIMTPFFYMLKKVGIMRVPASVEIAGLDVSYHGGSSYPGHEMHAMSMILDRPPPTTTKTTDLPSISGGLRLRNSMSRVSSGVSISGGGGGALHAIVEEAVMLALAEVERRGWEPPPPTLPQSLPQSQVQTMPILPTHYEEEECESDDDEFGSKIGSGGGGGGDDEGGGEEGAGDESERGGGNMNHDMMKSHSLAELQSAMQRQYSKTE